MGVMSAGDGYKYVLQSVAAGDGHRPLTTPLIAYYTEKGTPPGYWLGTGTHGLGTNDQRIESGGTVTEDHLRRPRRPQTARVGGGDADVGDGAQVAWRPVLGAHDA
jgi:hypothetical protein